jgi:hypothetical protein
MAIALRNYGNGVLVDDPVQRERGQLSLALCHIP